MNECFFQTLCSKIIFKQQRKTITNHELVRDVVLSRVVMLNKAAPLRENIENSKCFHEKKDCLFNVLQTCVKFQISRANNKKKHVLK